LLFNLIDLIVFSGLPAFIAFGLATAVAVRNVWRRVQSNAQALTIATAVLLILLLISGSTRGEVGRIWLFFMPLIALSGGLWVSAFLQGRWRAQCLLFVLQLGMVLALGLAWLPVNAVIVANPIIAAQSIPPQLDFEPLNAQFDDNIRLTEYAITPANDGNALDIALIWQAMEQASRPYTVFVHLLDAEGNLLAQQDGWSVDGQWPPTCWQPDSEVLDQRQIPLFDGASSLKIGLYDAQTGVRLLTTDGQDGVTVSVPTP